MASPFFKTRLTCSELNLWETKSSSDSLYCSSLPDEKIEEWVETGDSLRKSSSVNDIDRFHRYYDHVNARFRKMGDIYYPWDEYAMSVLELTRNSSLGLGQYTDDYMAMDLCTPNSNLTNTKPNRIKTSVHWITPVKSENLKKYKSFHTPKSGVRWITPKKQRDMSVDSPNTVESEWPTPGKVKDMIAYFSSPEVNLPFVAKDPNSTPKKNRLDSPELEPRRIVF